MIILKDIRKVYHKGKTNAYEALKGLSLTIHDGEMVAVIGRSGAGKSTLLHILACIDSYESGSYQIDDVEVGQLSERALTELRNEKIGLVMQDFALVEDMTALENVLIPLEFARPRPKDRHALAEQALASVGISDLAKKRAADLSGGQKQRVAIARAIVNEPSLILADEPTGALDTRMAAEIMTLFHALHQKGHTIIIVTHDPGVAAQCGRVVRIEDGGIVGE